MDKLIGKLAKETAKAGEKTAPLKSVKIKMKFQPVSSAKSKAIEKAKDHGRKG